MKLLLVVLMVFNCSCGKIDLFTAKIKGNTRTCIEGVEYIQFPSGVSVAYTEEGRIKTCNK